MTMSPITSQRKRCLGWGVLFASLLLANAAISWGIGHYSAPRAVAFDMKQTVDAFFDSASQKRLSEAQTRALSDRFNAALEQSLQTYQQQHHVLILVAPAVVQGAPDITRVIQQDIARRMREAS